MTAVTSVAAAIGVGAQDVAVAGGVEHMGRHPMGSDADPNPRFVAERLVAADALQHGPHRGEPARPLPRADPRACRRVRRREPGQVRRGARRRPDRAPTSSPVALRDPERGWGLATADEPPRPGTTLEGIRDLPTPFRRRRPGHRGDLGPADRRRRDVPARGRGHRRGARPGAADAAGHLRVRRGRPGRHGPRPGPRDRARARPRRPDHRRHRPRRDQRGLRRAGARVPRRVRPRRRRPARQPRRRRDRRRAPARVVRACGS